MDNGRDGWSEPFTLAHLMRLPKVDSFQLDAATLPSSIPAPPTGTQSFDLTGTNLEMIEKVGWDGAAGVDVPGLPTPILGKGQEQLLTVNLPQAPNPQAPLFIWLRGESSGRATTISQQNAARSAADTKNLVRSSNK